MWHINMRNERPRPVYEIIVKYQQNHNGRGGLAVVRMAFGGSGDSGENECGGGRRWRISDNNVAK